MRNWRAVSIRRTFARYPVTGSSSARGQVYASDNLKRATGKRAGTYYYLPAHGKGNYMPTFKVYAEENLISEHVYDANSAAEAVEKFKKELLNNIVDFSSQEGTGVEVLDVEAV